MRFSCKVHGVYERVNKNLNCQLFSFEGISLPGTPGLAVNSRIIKTLFIKLSYK